MKYFEKSRVDLITRLHSKFYFLSKKLLSNAWSVSSLLFRQSTSHSCVCSPTGLYVSGEEFGCFHINGNIYICSYMNSYFIMLANGTCIFRYFPIRLLQFLAIVGRKDSQGNLQSMCTVCIEMHPDMGRQMFPIYHHVRTHSEYEYLSS